MKIMLMGPRFNRKNPLITCGTTTLFEDLLKQVKINNIDCIVIDTNKKNYVNFIFAYMSIFIQMLFKQKKCNHISLHSSQDYIIFGPIAIILGRIFNKKVSLRKFAGDAKKTYLASRGIKKILLEFIYKNMNILFFEIKYLVEFFSNKNKNTFWFPNVRSRILEPTLPRIFHKRFVFISSIMHEKGIDEILQASMKLQNSYKIDIYGPIMESKYTKEYFEKYNVIYHGALETNDVVKNLNKYDVLLLPSYKEGYPGIVIEAYSLGMPIISSTLRNIEEIVESYETGILVNPGDVDGLTNAIKGFNEKNYSYMSKNAYEKFDDFKSDIQTKIFLERLKNV